MTYDDVMSRKITFIHCIIKHYLRHQNWFSNVLLRLFDADNQFSEHICGNNLIFTTFHNCKRIYSIVIFKLLSSYVRISKNNTMIVKTRVTCTMQSMKVIRCVTFHAILGDIFECKWVLHFYVIDPRVE